VNATSPLSVLTNVN